MKAVFKMKCAAETEETTMAVVTSSTQSMEEASQGVLPPLTTVKQRIPRF